jgi:hypothetical protein
VLIVGIDPGVSGGIAALDERCHLKFKTAMPVMTVEKQSKTKAGNKRKGTEYRAELIAQIIKQLNPDRVFIEKQQAMPKQGAVSMFTLGTGYGLLRGICVGLGVSTHLVRPTVWQKDILNAARGDTKNKSILFCTTTWPSLDFRENDRCRVDHDGICDAVCIAEYGRRLMNGSLPTELEGSEDEVN